LVEAPDELMDEWVSSYADHIRRKYGAARVKLTGHVHGLPSREEVRDGRKLNDPASYESSEFGVFE